MSRQALVVTASPAAYCEPRFSLDMLRGPLVYCAEEVDNGGDLNAIVVPKDLPHARTEVLADLNGAVAIDLAVERGGDAADIRHPARTYPDRVRRR